MKVNCFGIHNEACKLQMNYLFDESQTIQPDNKKCHGPNNVISMIDDFLSNFGLGEKSASFHADNCSGQNKNKSVIHYFIYRCSKGMHEDIQYHFMEVGHTKCICDSAFGKIRQLYRRSDVDTMVQLCDVVNKSSKVNSSRPYTSQTTTNDGQNESNYQWREWDEFFKKYMKCLRGISAYHHFRFTKDDPGAVYVKKSISDPEERVYLVKRGVTWPPTDESLPPVLPAGGLSRQRYHDLQTKVLRYVREPYRGSFFPITATQLEE